MLDIKSICLRANSKSENSPEAEIIIEVTLADGRHLELGREQLPGSVSHCWNIDSIDPDNLKKSELSHG